MEVSDLKCCVERRVAVTSSKPWTTPSQRTTDDDFYHRSLMKRLLCDQSALHTLSPSKIILHSDLMTSQIAVMQMESTEQHGG